MKREDLILVLKLQQWEKCKGELAALVALEGAHTSTYEPCNYSQLKEKISKFIEEIQEESLLEP
jgi:uncharacterized protein YehS (DUF1456 family)